MNTKKNAVNYRHVSYINIIFEKKFIKTERKKEEDEVIINP